MMMNPGQGMQGPHHGPMPGQVQGPPGPQNQPQPPPGAAQLRPQPQPRPEDVGRMAKSRDLVPVLHDKWSEALREGAAALHQSSNDREDGTGSQNRFETSVEDFYSTLDQIELNLKCAAETTGQSQASSKYMIGSLNYHQHISAAKHQVAFNKQIKEMLRSYAQEIVDHTLPVPPQHGQTQGQQQS